MTRPIRRFRARSAADFRSGAVGAAAALGAGAWHQRRGAAAGGPERRSSAEKQTMAGKQKGPPKSAGLRRIVRPLNAAQPASGALANPQLPNPNGQPDRAADRAGEDKG